jgi:D-xylonolactonase
MAGGLKCEWQIEAELGEGPLWVTRENALYWVDILQQKVHRYSVTDGAKKTWTFDTQVTSLAEREQGGFAATVRDGFAFIDFASRSIEAIAFPEVALPGNRFNDGKVDKYGRYWGGSMNENEEVASGSLYCLDVNLKLSRMDGLYIISNGPAFSVDNSIVYHTDSAKRVVYAFDQNEKGELSNKREFIRLEDDAEGAPDGMTVDEEGCIWLCHYGGSRITRYSPEGDVLQVVPMPVPNITSCTFGGRDLDSLYITTARAGIPGGEIDRYPLAGSLFSLKTGVRGVPMPRFAG